MSDINPYTDPEPAEKPTRTPRSKKAETAVSKPKSTTPKTTTNPRAKKVLTDSTTSSPTPTVNSNVKKSQNIELPEPVVKTVPIKLEKVIEEVRTTATDPEDIARPRNRNIWPRTIAIIVSFIVLVLAVSVILITVNQSKTTLPVDDSPYNPIPTATSTDSSGYDLSDENTRFEIVQNTTQEAMDKIASQVANQYGADKVGEIKLSSTTSQKDNQGNLASTAIASVNPVPLDFNVADSIKWFEDNVSSMGSDGTWAFSEPTINADQYQGVSNVRTILFYDTAKNPTLPMTIEISYFQKDGDNSLTISVTTSMYYGS